MNYTTGTTSKEVIAAASRLYGVTPEALLARNNTSPAQEQRQAAMVAARLATTDSFPTIGVAFDRDNTTVLYAWKKAQRDPLLMADAQEIARHCRLDVQLPLT